MRGYFLCPGSMALSLSISPGLATGAAWDALAAVAVWASIFAAGGAVDDLDSTPSFATPLAFAPAAGFASGSFDFGSCAEPGSGVAPLTIFSAEKRGTVSVSFFTRIETLRLEGSVGLLFTRSIWSA